MARDLSWRNPRWSWDYSLFSRGCVGRGTVFSLVISKRKLVSYDDERVQITGDCGLGSHPADVNKINTEIAAEREEFQVLLDTDGFM